MSKKRYVIIVLATFVIVAFFWGGFFPQVLPSRDVNWIADVYAVKEEKARASSDQKLVLVAGSSGLFGLSAEMMEGRLGLPVVNFATHAGFGLRYLLYRAKGVLNAGDKIFLGLEYELLARKKFPGQILTNFVSAKDPDFVGVAPIKWTPYFFTGHNYKSFLWALIEKLGVWKYSQSCYGSAVTLTTHGDETCANTPSFSTAYPYILRSQGVLTPIDFSPLRFDPSLIDFVKWADERDIEIIIGFPPLLDKPDYKEEAYMASFSALVVRLKNLNVRVLGAPQDYFYPEEYFYDTRYHLHGKARDIHTRSIISQICLEGTPCR